MILQGVFGFGSEGFGAIWDYMFSNKIAFF